MIYEGMTVCITTKHAKLRAIKDDFEQILKVKLVACELDTDQWGTFTGEVERKHSAKTCVKLKCLAGMQYLNLSLGIASEGSFGAHPYLPFTAIDEEIMCFIDRERDLVIYESLKSTSTNYKMQEIFTAEQLIEFAQLVGFPLHGLILKPSQQYVGPDIVKGIVDWEVLMTSFNKLKITNDSVWCQTDMRAHLNPTRMAVIKQLTHKLVSRIASLCPSCGIPGFGCVEVQSGLPCEWCHTPTDLTLKRVFGCIKCNYLLLLPREDSKEHAAQHCCPVCNP